MGLPQVRRGYGYGLPCRSEPWYLLWYLLPSWYYLFGDRAGISFSVKVGGCRRYLPGLPEGQEVRWEELWPWKLSADGREGPSQRKQTPVSVVF